MSRAFASFRQAIGRLVQRASGQEFSFFGLIGASTGLASDIYEPLLPSTALWLLASIAGFAICVRVFSRATESDVWKQKISGDGAIFFGGSIPVVLILAVSQFVFPADPDENDSLMARVFPAVESLQVSIGVLDERLASIDQGIAEIGDEVSAMREDMQGLKRETSENPRKELQNLGVDWNGDNFLNALADGDMLITKLFLVGGIRPETARSQGRPLPVMLAKNTFNVDEVLDALVENGLDVDYAFPSGSVSGPQSYTILGWAVERENTALIRALDDHDTDLNQQIEAFAALGMGVRTFPLAVSVGRGYLDAANLLLDLGADAAVGDYLAYRTAQANKEKLVAQHGEQAVAALISRLAPGGNAKDRINAEIRLVEIGRELNDVAMQSLRAVSVAEKQRYDTRYDELQAERAALKDRFDIED